MIAHSKKAMEQYCRPVAAFFRRRVGSTIRQLGECETRGWRLSRPRQMSSGLDVTSDSQLTYTYSFGP
jgi:hypothetical protein